MKTIKKTFTVEASPEIMRRFESFLGLIHYCSNWGSSGISGIYLDGDGDEHVYISPMPENRKQVSKISDWGYDLMYASGGNVLSGYSVDREKNYRRITPDGNILRITS